jgi:hypothetical protein
MIIKKITTGVVIQDFDTDKQEFVSQVFVAADQVDYEAEDGSPINVADFEDRVISNKSPYLPMSMKQPLDIEIEDNGRECYACNEPIRHLGKFCMSCGAEQKMT